jgi:ribosomal protein L23
MPDEPPDVLRNMVSLKDYFDEKVTWVVRHFEALQKENDRRYTERFNAQEKATKTALDSASIAVAKSEAAVTKRMEAANEVRGTMNDFTNKTMMRSEIQAIFQSQDEKIETLNRDVSALREARVQTIGQSLGSKATIAWVVTAATVIIALVSAIVLFR